MDRLLLWAELVPRISSGPGTYLSSAAASSLNYCVVQNDCSLQCTGGFNPRADHVAPERRKNICFCLFSFGNAFLKGVGGSYIVRVYDRVNLSVFASTSRNALASARKYPPYICVVQRNASHSYSDSVFSNTSFLEAVFLTPLTSSYAVMRASERVLLIYYVIFHCGFWLLLLFTATAFNSFPKKHELASNIWRIELYCCSYFLHSSWILLVIYKNIG